MIVKSYAKINISLKVLGKREDGYHDLEMVMLPLELHDIIDITKLGPNQDTYIVCDDIRLNSKNNICKKALDLLREKYKFTENFLIQIHKEIPMMAGLGGGSSNAAAILTSLNKILNLKIKEEELIELAKTLGADVPFFIKNKPCLVEGIGEKMTEIPVKFPYFCLIVKPQKGLSTVDVFKKCDNFPRLDINTELVLEGLKKDDLLLVKKGFGNDLMGTSISLLPDIGEIYSKLREDGFDVSLMSGSGSSLFALSKDAKKVKEAYKKYVRKGYDVRLTRVIA